MLIKYLKKRIRLSRNETLIVDIKNIGLVGFKRSYRAKRLIIKIKEDASVLVSVPKGVNFNVALNFVFNKTEWIKKNLKKINIIKEQKIKSVKKITLVDKKTAKNIILKRVEYLADHFGFKYNKVFVKNQKTLWGSCSSKNNLNFNYKIASLPEKLMDYVILHELVHTKIKNHSNLFWNTLDNYVQDSKSLRKELKKIQFTD